MSAEPGEECKFTPLAHGMLMITQRQKRRRNDLGCWTWPAAAFVLAVALSGCGAANKAEAQNAAQAATAPVVKATRRDIADNLQIASEFLPFQEINVYAKVSGYIQKLYVDWGSHVRQGQILAVLEIPELEQQLQQDEATVARAKEDLNRDQSAFNVADVTYKRLLDVQKSRPELVAQQDIDVSQGKDLEASAAVSAAKQALIAAQATLAKDQAMYGYARITAPFDGVVTEIDAYTGALLPAGTSSNKGDQALCHLSDNRLLRLVIPVPQSAIPDIRLGSKAEVRVPVLNKMFQGTVARVSDEVDLSTRTMHTEIDVPNPRLEIVPGMYAEASLVLREKRGALVVPVEAVETQQGQASVLLVDKDHVVQQKQVQVGIETPDWVEVLSGLEEGDLVVVGNRSQLRPGTTVQPKLVSSSAADGGM